MSGEGDDVLDEAYERLFGYGPEFEGYLSNHGPMVVEVLDRYGRSDATEPWLDEYTKYLEPAPAPSWPIEPDGWREALGDPKRVGDWISFLETECRERPWREVLLEWWPRLMPGAVGSATHGIIRTGHALRALERRQTESRVRELALSLGYWAARFHPLPPASQPRGNLGAEEALAQLPRIEEPVGGAAARLSQVAALTRWTDAVSSLRSPASPEQVPAELEALADAAVAQYLGFGRANPIMLVHAATAPAAAVAALRSLPVEDWTTTWDGTWRATAAITSCYAVGGTEAGELVPALTPEEVMSRAVDNGDEHVIKFADAAVQAHRRGCEAALSAASLAAALVV